MLERIEHDNGVVTYQSPLFNSLGVLHAFSTRIGGISAPPFDTLNLGRLDKTPATDGNTSVSENFRRLRQALGLRQYMRTEVRQVHGCHVWHVPALPVKPADSPQADALVTERSMRMLLVRTADCLPVLLTSRDGRFVAAIHAGWRGVIADVITATANRMQELYALPSTDLCAAIGPCISVQHFEVGEDVARQFAAANLEECIAYSLGPKPHLCLRSAAKLQLQRLRIRESDIDTTDRCTYRDEQEFFSYRRDVTHRSQPRTGHMAAVIAVKK